MRRTLLSAGVSGILDMGASDPRLERLARLAVAKYWPRQDDEDAARGWVFLFRKAGRYVYMVVPVYRRRYHAVVRFPRRLMTLDGPGLDDLDVRSISVLESDALRLATDDVGRDP